MKISSAIKKAAASVTALAMLLCMTSCGKKGEPEKSDPVTETVKEQQTYSVTPDEITKNETVYINLDNSGKVENISVTDWIHTNKGEVCVKDKSDLKNIENIKSDIMPVIGKDFVEWNMPGTDIYYGGTSDKKLPVDFEITYKLDGKAITPEHLAGKSGKVEINVKMKNKLFKTVEINGKKQKIYLPVMVAGGFILPEADFSGISVKNGRSIGDGTKEIAVLFGLPGMSESLGLKGSSIDGLIMGNTASVTAQTVNFELSNMYFAVIPLCTLGLDIEADGTAGDLDSLISILKELQNVAGSLDFDEIITAFRASPDNKNSIVSLLTNAVSLYNGNKALLKVLTKYASPENGEQLKRLLEFLTDSGTVKALSVLSDSDVINFFRNLSRLDDSVPMLSSLVNDLNDPDVKKAIENLPQTMEQISQLESALEGNKKLIDNLLGIFSEENIKSLDKISEILASTDFGSLEEKYADLAKNADVIATRFGKWMEYGEEYRIFTDAPENAKTSLLFVYQTPSVSPNTEAEKPSEISDNASPLDSFIKKFR